MDELKEVWHIQIISENKKGKPFVEEFWEEERVQAVRCILSYKCKRNYKMVAMTMTKAVEMNV